MIVIDSLACIETFSWQYYRCICRPFHIHLDNFLMVNLCWATEPDQRPEVNWSEDTSMRLKKHCRQH